MIVMRRPWVCTASAITALIAVAVAAYLWFWTYDGRQDIDLRRFVENDSPFMPGAHLATEELCGPELPCSQAVDSDTLTMFRFDSQDQASATASTFRDARLAGWIVVTFKENGLDEEERGDFMGALYCTHVASDPC
jgi:hypothetical protein